MFSWVFSQWSRLPRVWVIVRMSLKGRARNYLPIVTGLAILLAMVDCGLGDETVSLQDPISPRAFMTRSYMYDGKAVKVRGYFRVILGTLMVFQDENLSHRLDYGSGVIWGYDTRPNPTFGLEGWRTERKCTERYAEVYGTVRYLYAYKHYGFETIHYVRTFEDETFSDPGSLCYDEVRDRGLIQVPGAKDGDVSSDPTE